MSDVSKICGRLGDRAAGQILGVGISLLDGYWLELECCAGTTLLPVRLVIERQGGRRTLRHVLDRLKCQRCGGPPRRAWLNETHSRVFHHGAEPGWSVRLIPAAPDEIEEAAE